MPGRVFPGESVRAVLPSGNLRRPLPGRLRPSGPCFLELFAGCARRTSAVCDAGLTVWTPFEPDTGDTFTSRPKVVAELALAKTYSRLRPAGS